MAQSNDNTNRKKSVRFDEVQSNQIEVVFSPVKHPQLRFSGTVAKYDLAQAQESIPAYTKMSTLDVPDSPNKKLSVAEKHLEKLDIAEINSPALRAKTFMQHIKNNNLMNGMRPSNF